MMTVAVYRDGVLASDRAVSTDNDLIACYRTKIRKTNGKLIATAGQAQNGVAFQEWFHAGEPPDKKPDLDNDFIGLVIDANGTINIYNNKLYSYVAESSCFAIGNGHHVAMGAMEMGATAEQAVSVACQYVLGCGGGVDVLRLDSPLVASPASAAATPPQTSMGTMGT